MSTAVNRTPDAPPRIGKYVVRGRIGRGGMGMVYRGYDEQLEREVAVKTLTVEGMRDEESRKRFQIEARAVARLQHPNIVTVYELGEERGTPFIVMELLGGSDLESLTRSGEQLLLQEKLDALVQILRALAYAHERHIIHRDVKPSNIRLLEDGTAKMMDFGIAKLAGTDVTKTGMMVGTVHYMSPEQVRGHTLDGRSDVFSAGVILYELLAGRRPFGAGTATDVLTRIVREPAPALPALNEGPQVTAELIAICERALAKDPAARFTSATEMADELARVAARLPRPEGEHGPVGEMLAASRRLLREGRYEESIQRLEQLTSSHPLLLEARRTLRTAKREAEKKQKEQKPQAPETFPELTEAFPGALPTQVIESTRVMEEAAPTINLQAPTRVETAPRTRAEPVARTRVVPVAPPTGGRGLLLAGAALLLIAAGAGVVLLGGRKPPEASVPAPPPVATLPATPVTLPPAVSAVRLPVRSQPAGAQVTVDGAPRGVTPLELELARGRDHQVRLTLADHEPQELKVIADAVPPALDVTLVPAGPPGQLRIASEYPIDVTWRGRTLAKDERSPVVKLARGRQAVTLTAPKYALRQTLNVDVRAGETASLAAPALGKLNIRANPDNCQVFVDGIFLDYPPILDRAVASGAHRVEFRWPDGTRRDEQVDVRAGAPAYVSGRKD